MIDLGLSIAGRVAGASPGPGFPGALDLVWRTIDPPPAARVADLGAGLGGASVWMQQRGANVTAFEVESECVAAGKSLFPKLDLRVPTRSRSCSTPTTS